MVIVKDLKQEGYDKVNEDFDTYLHPRIFETLHQNGLDSEDLKRLYFNGEDLSKKDDQRIADLWGDMHFVDGIHKVIRIQVDQSSAPTYFYQFTYDKGFSFIKTKINNLVKGNITFLTRNFF